MPKPTLVVEPKKRPRLESSRNGVENDQKESTRVFQTSSSGRLDPSHEETNNCTSDNNKNNNNGDPPLISPHTLRLLKLIQDGTEEHARMAAEQLQEISKQAASPLVLWDILGRLQGFLISPHWNTRRNAQLAMEGVARNLPASDQTSFLQAARTDSKESQSWLRLTDVKQHLKTILDQGQLLMANSESKFQVQSEERQLEMIGEEGREEKTSEDGDFSYYCERRLEMQRRILSRRLGLSDVMTRYTEDIREQFHSDLLQEAMGKEADVVEERAKRTKIKHGPTAHPTAPSSIRELLVKEMRQQQQQNSSPGLHMPQTLSHRSAQALLAGELVYRMFDAAWHVRHGALMGILALLRAWKDLRSDQNSDFGIWPLDIFARTICVLALDRFGDFSGSSSEAFSGSMVAPVREVSGQLFSIIFLMAPQEIQGQSIAILVDLAKSEEWEVRHGVLVALKYQISLFHSDDCSDRKGKTLHEVTAVNLAKEGLQDSSDDVQGLAAQVLLQHLNRCCTEERKDTTDFHSEIGRLAWDALEATRPFSSSVEDLVALFTQTALAHFGSTSRSTTENGSQLNMMATVYGRLSALLASEYTNVKISIVHAMGILGRLIPSSIASWESCYMSLWSGKTESKSSGTITLPLQFRQCYCDVVISIYDLRKQFFEVSVENNDNRQAKALAEECSNAWKVLSSANHRILSRSDPLRLNLEGRLLSDFFCLSEDISLAKVSTNARITSHIDGAQSLAYFWVLPYDMKCGGRVFPLLRFFLLAALGSPVLLHCQKACCLTRALLRLNKLNDSLSKMLEDCADEMHKLLSSGPGCLSCSSGWDLSNQKDYQVILQTFRWGINSIDTTDEADNGSKALKAVCEVWERLQKSSTNPGSSSSNIDSMRLKALMAGSIICRIPEKLPEKLTPLIRPFMTSLQNERGELWQQFNCECLGEFLLLLQYTESGRFEGLNRTFGKVMGNLCSMVATSDEPCCSSASCVIGLFLGKLPSWSSLCSFTPIWERLSPLCGPWDEADTNTRRESLLILKAVCRGPSPNAEMTEEVTETFCAALIFVACEDDYPQRRDCSMEIIRSLCSCNCFLFLSYAVPALTKYLKVEKEQLRRTACYVLVEIVNHVKSPSALCPFIRDLLPVAMALMTDSMKEIANAAAGLFSRLVQVAPLVVDTESVDHDSEVDGFDLVIKHLIHGKKLPKCQIPGTVLKHLDEAGIVLRDYQYEGISWLQFLQSVKLNGALCDSMGLGKTATALIALAMAHLNGRNSTESSIKSLIVCPSSVVGHWMNEIKKFLPNTPAFNAVGLIGSGKERKAIFGKGIKQDSLVVTSYAVLRSDIEALCEFDWEYVVLDEGHLLKNPKTASARASRRLKSNHKLVLSGTPVQNHVNEVWAIFDFLMPHFLGSSIEFSKEFAVPISRGQKLDSKAGDVALGMEKLKQLHQQVLPFLLRREKEQVLKELPPKIITRIPCAMSPLQNNLYRHFCSGPAGKQSLLVLNQFVSSLSGRKESFDLGANALRSLLYLRLVCTHPWLVRSRDDSSLAHVTKFFNLETSGKLVALMEILRECSIVRNELTAADNDSSLIYCETEDYENHGGDEYEKAVALSTNDLGTTTDEGPTELTDRSKCLIFAQFMDSLDVVEEVVLKKHMPSSRYLRLDGRVPITKRAGVVDAFNNDENISVLLLTTKIGGLGLNLTSADTVIFLEHDWNPHVDLQAMDRAHRLGQNKTVHVYQLITEDSIEEKMIAIHEKKMAMSKAIVNTENSSLYSLGTDRLLDIFQVRSEAAESTDRIAGFEDNLDTLIERFSDEYESLSVNHFVKSFQQKLHSGKEV